MRGHLSNQVLNAYIDEDLSPSDAKAVEKHLHSCPACRTKADSLQKTARFLQGLGVSGAAAEEAGEGQSEAGDEVEAGSEPVSSLFLPTINMLKQEMSKTGAAKGAPESGEASSRRRGWGGFVLALLLLLILSYGIQSLLTHLAFGTGGRMDRQLGRFVEAHRDLEILYETVALQ